MIHHRKQEHVLMEQVAEHPLMNALDNKLLSDAEICRDGAKCTYRISHSISRPLLGLSPLLCLAQTLQS